jgi:NAD(P)-dependent dehydrogenase (short-subunit alcohol dehydrogenase family)
MKTVIVTGAAGGIGIAAIKMCAARGYQVYAGAIDDWEMGEIQSIKEASPHGRNIIPVMLDTREVDHIADLAARVEEEDPEYLGLVLNGAACPTAVPFEHLDIDYVTRDVFDTNVFGNLKMIQMFLPTLKKVKGRVVLVSSLFGKTGDSMLLSYASSKHACEGYCTVLRRELKRFGIKVVVTNPGVVKETYMMHNHHTQIRKWLADIQGVTEQEVTPKSYDPGKNTKLKQPTLVMDKTYIRNNKSMLGLLESGLVSPMSVTPEGCAKHIMKGLEDENPKVRYVSGWDAKILIFLTRIMPERLGDKLAEKIAG